MSDFKIGDKVKIRPDLKAYTLYGTNGAVSDMVEFAGVITNIKSNSTDSRDGEVEFFLECDDFGWSWTPEMLIKMEDN